MTASPNVFAQQNALADQNAAAANDVSTKKKLEVQARHLTQRYSEGEELLFTLVVDKYALGELVTQVKHGQYYVLFDDLIVSADFAIEATFSKGQTLYQGFWSKRSNTFSLLLSADLTQNEYYQAGAVALVTLNGQTFPVSDKDLYQIGREVYVSAGALERWFMTQLSFEETELQVLAKNQILWPFQQSQVRENTKVSSISRVGAAQELHHDYGYGFRSPQAIDLIVGARGTRLGEDVRDFQGNYSVVGRQDLLGVSSRFFFAGDTNDVLSQGTVDFSKFWLGENSGPLGLTRLNFGDVQGVRVGNNSISARRGISLSNVPFNNQTQQEQTNVTGLVQAGWDVELYQNGVLIKQLFDVQQGRYEFLDLSLFAGMNTFDVVKYGPEGQVEKETIERLLTGSFASLFKPTYEVSLTQNNASLLDIQENTLSNSAGFSLDGRYEVALAENFGLNAGHSISLGNSLANNVYTLGAVYRPFNRLLLDADYQFNEGSSHQFDLAARTNLWQQTLSLRGSVSRNISGTSTKDTSVNSSLSASGSLLNTELVKVFQQTELAVGTTFNDTDFLNFSNRLSFHFKPFSINNSFDWRKRSLADGTQEDIKFGNLNLVTSVGKVFTRAGLSYQMLEESAEVDSAFISSNWFAFDKYAFRAEIAHSFIDENTRYSLGVDWRHQLFAINTRIEHSELFDTSFNISARISFAEAPTEFGYIQDRNSLANAGTLLVRVYHDVNNNRVFDGDDIPLKGAKVEAVQSRRIVKTDVIGIAQLNSLRNFTKTDIKIDKTSIENPLLVQSTINAAVTPRPGLISVLNYPMIEGAEIEGELTFMDEFGRLQYVANAPIEIRDARGNVVETLKSGFDGYFYFTGLVPHIYSLHVSPEFLERFAFEAHAPITLAVKNQGEQLLGLNVRLEKKQKVEGFIVHSGVFENAPMLQTYYELFLRRLSQIPDRIDTSPFKHELDTGRYTLGIKFVSTKIEADATCLWLAQYFNNCSVRDHTFYITKNGS